jgi:NAD(P)-dependent dehydrogenase (short-subunit alcohol dehydrogenase family)
MAGRIDFTGQVAIVTGAGRGLGRSHALLLAARGAKLLVNDFGTAIDGSGVSSNPAEAVVAEIRAAGGEAYANFDSVATGEGATAMVEAAIAQFGRVDILVCNAGNWSSQPMEEIGDEIWRRTLAVHLDGTLFTTRAAWPHMRRQNYGRLVFTASSIALYGKQGVIPYGAAKAGIFGIMKSLADEIGEDDIRVNTIMPGAVTRMLPAETRTFWKANPGDVNAGLGEPEQVSPLVAYLASRSCATNGQAYSAGAGFFARDAVLQSQGVRFDYREGISPEQIADQWEKINDMTNANCFETAMKYGANMFGISK